MNETYYVITPHGNPFPISVTCSPDEVIDMIRRYVQDDVDRQGYANNYDLYECKTTFCHQIRGEDLHEEIRWTRRINNEKA